MAKKKLNTNYFTEVYDKGLYNIVIDFQKALTTIDQHIKAHRLSVDDVMKITGLSESQYHRRRQNPATWTVEELLLIAAVVTPEERKQKKPK